MRDPVRTGGLLKPSTMRSTTGMALFGRFTTAPQPEITRSSVVTGRPREAAPSAAATTDGENVTERTSPGPSRTGPVFVDASGRRGRLFRPLGITLDCILAIPIILGGLALATDVGLPSVPWPASAGSGSTSGNTSGSARTSVAPVFTPSTTGARATTVRRSTTSTTGTTGTTSTTTSAGGPTPVPTPIPTTAPAGRRGHE